MSLSPPNELVQAREFIDEGKHDEALKLMESFDRNERFSAQECLICKILKCELLFQQGLFENLLNLAEQTYKDSLELRSDSLSFDALMWKARALIYLFRLDDGFNIIKQGEELLEKLLQEPPTDYKQREATIVFVKALFSYWEKRDANIALEQLEYCLTLREELGNKPEIILTEMQIAKTLIYGKGELDTATKYLEHGITLAKKINNKFNLAWGFLITAVSYSLKGDLDQCIQLNEQSLKLFAELKNKFMMRNVLNNMSDAYRLKGDLDCALELMEKRFELCSESQSIRELAVGCDPLIQTYILKGDIANAQQYLDKMEQLVINLKDKQINRWYLFDKALILKTSLRAHKRVKAEEILKNIILDKDPDYELTVRALLNLCELLLIELQITNEVEVLDEVKSIITQLLDVAEKSHSYWIWGETFVLQAQLALLSLNLKEARRLLTQGQKIAEKYGLESLAIKISNKHDELFKQLNLWEEIKSSKASLKERFELTGLKEQMNSMLQKSAFIPSKMEAEQPISLIIITESGKPLLLNHFTADMVIDDTQLGVFLSSFKIYCNQIFSEIFDRVKLGQYTVLITPVYNFSICYLFQGQTYSAQHKVKHFSEALKMDKHLIGLLETAQNEDRIVQVDNNPHFEELIIESFMSDPNKFLMPFKAYEGEDSYVFTSYAHADKLEVYPIIDYLNKMGINIWYDEGIPVSENWKKSIAVNLERCSKFLVFITPHIIDSEYVRKEISFAVKKKKPFIAVYLKETQLPTELEFEIADIQAIMKYLLPKGEFFNKLKDTLDESIHNE